MTELYGSMSIQNDLHSVLVHVIFGRDVRGPILGRHFWGPSHEQMDIQPSAETQIVFYVILYRDGSCSPFKRAFSQGCLLF